MATMERSHLILLKPRVFIILILENVLHFIFSFQTNMEKRRNTLDRLQKLGFGRKTSTTTPPGSSSNTPTNNRKSSDKTERLKELTELLKGTNRNSSSQSVPQLPVTPPPVPPPRRPRHSQHSIDKPIFELPSTSEENLTNHSGSCGDVVDDKLVRKISLKSGGSSLELDDPNAKNIMPSSSLPKSTSIFSMNSTNMMAPPTTLSSTSSNNTSLYRKLRPNTSVSNLENIMLSRGSGAGLSVEPQPQQQPHTAPPAPIAPDEDDLFNSQPPRVESKTIIGAYTQKSIPFRSASFSQVDYTSGKYIRSALGAIKAAFRKDKEVSVVESANLTLPRRKTSSASTHSEQIQTVCDGKSIKKTEISINLVRDSLEGSDLQMDPEEGVILEDKPILQSPLYSKPPPPPPPLPPFSYPPFWKHPESIFEPPPLEYPRDVELFAQTSEIQLETLTEEEIPSISMESSLDESFLQTANTCLIPVPVYECVAGRDWDERVPVIEEVHDDEEIPNLIEEMGVSLDMIQEINECEIAPDTIDDSSCSRDVPSTVGDLSDVPTEIIVELIDEAVEEEMMEEDGGESLDGEKVVQEILAGIAEEEAKREKILTKQMNVDELTRSLKDDFTEEKSPPSGTESIDDDPTSQKNEEKRIQEELQNAVSEYVEVRKRHSNNQEKEKSLESTSSLKSIESQFEASSGLVTPNGEERRRIDKSRRRKGIYIQWPTINKNCEGGESDGGAEDNLTPEETKIAWQCDKITQQVLQKTDTTTELELDFSAIKGASHSDQKLGTNLLMLSAKPSDDSRYSGSQCSIEPLTPESEYNRPVWPKYSRRQSLTMQSSDEKDEPPLPPSTLSSHQHHHQHHHHQHHHSGITTPTTPLTPSSGIQSPSIRPYKKSLQYIRSDSISDNESDRTPPRERSSASPAPHDQDLKRYSKRPLRGPYGQMLEAEMKKPAKLYDELLEELNRSEK